MAEFCTVIQQCCHAGKTISEVRSERPKTSLYIYVCNHTRKFQLRVMSLTLLVLVPVPDCQLPVPVLSIHLFSIVIPFCVATRFRNIPSSFINLSTAMVIRNNYCTGNVIRSLHPSADTITRKITVQVMQSGHFILVPVW